MILFLISIVTPSVKYSAATEALLAVVVGVVLFVTGAVAASILLFLMLKMYIGNVHAMIVSSASSSSMDRSTEVNLNVDSDVQRNQVSREHETLQEHTTAISDTDSSSGHTIIKVNRGAAKRHTIRTKKDSSSGLYHKPAKDIRSGDAKYNNSRSVNSTDNSRRVDVDYNRNRGPAKSAGHQDNNTLGMVHVRDTSRTNLNERPNLYLSSNIMSPKPVKTIILPKKKKINQ